MNGDTLTDFDCISPAPAIEPHDAQPFDLVVIEQRLSAGEPFFADLESVGATE